MFFIKDFTKITEEKYSIGFTHFMPFDSKDGMEKTEEGLLKEGKLVVGIEPLKVDNKTPVMYYNPISNNVFYEYEDIKIESQKEEQTIPKRLEAVEIAIANIIGGV